MPLYQSRSSSLLGGAKYYGMAPGDYGATVAINAPFPFPQDGSNFGSQITRISSTTFNLINVGVYLITWQISVDEAAQTTLWADSTGAFAPASRVIDSCVGRATGTNQIVGNTLLVVSAVNTQIRIYNDASAAALTVTPIAGGTQDVSASITICRVS